jgi:hypothetical protein
MVLGVPQRKKPFSFPYINNALNRGHFATYLKTQTNIRGHHNAAQKAPPQNICRRKSFSTVLSGLCQTVKEPSMCN